MSVVVVVASGGRTPQIRPQNTPKNTASRAKTTQLTHLRAACEAELVYAFFRVAGEEINDEEIEKLHLVAICRVGPSHCGIPSSSQPHRRQCVMTQIASTRSNEMWGRGGDVNKLLSGHFKYLS